MGPPSSATTTGGEEEGNKNTTVLQSDDPMAVRKWLSMNYPKQLSSLDKFEIELRLGRLTSTSSSSSSPNNDTADAETVMYAKMSPRLLVTLQTLELLKNIMGATRWKNAAQLLTLLRGLGRELHAVGGFKEPAIENIVRRVMAAVREEVLSDEEQAGNPRQQQQHLSAKQPSSVVGGRLTLQSILWALPQHVKRTPSSGRSASMRGESFASESELLTGGSGGAGGGTAGTEYPPIYYTNRPELKHSIMEHIQEITTELEDLHKNINDEATNHIHAGEIILTYGRSKTVELFLKAAAEKNRKFQVVVCEGSPHYGGHELAKSLSESGIDTIVVNDSATFAVMARVNKVLLPAHAVLANGGLITTSGCNMIALSAYHNSVPVVCLTGMFKLCPMYPHEGQDTLNDLLSPSSISPYADMSSNGNLLEQVEFVNPLHDYIKPEHLNLYVTNVGSFQPSFIYRLLAEYYHNDDWESFE